MRPANPYQHPPEPHFKQISNWKKRKSTAKTLKSGEFQQVPRGLLKGSAVFRPFAEDDLYIEIQLVFREEKRPRMLAAFIETVARMRERMQRGALRFSTVRVPQLSPARPALRRDSRVAGDGHV